MTDSLVTDNVPPLARRSAADSDCIMALAGPDAAQFLQGQSTNDFANTIPGDARFAAFCNPKGRVLADLLVVTAAPESFFLRGRRDVMTALSAHLKPYLAFSKSNLTLLDWAVTCVSTEERTMAAPVAHIEWQSGVPIAISVPRGECYIEHWRAKDTIEQQPSMSEVALAEVDIKTLRARIETETIGAYLPQDLNFDLNGTVSFNKGCYTGQEIIARLHYRGTPKRRLYAGQLANSAIELSAGSSLEDPAGNKIGTVVNYYRDTDHISLLAELVPASAENDVTLAEGGARVECLTAC